MYGARSRWRRSAARNLEKVLADGRRAKRRVVEALVAPQDWGEAKEGLQTTNNGGEAVVPNGEVWVEGTVVAELPEPAWPL